MNIKIGILSSYILLSLLFSCQKNNGTTFIYSPGVYIAGVCDDTAVYWKNGKKINLSDGKNKAKAVSIYVTNKHVYVVGYEIIDGNHTAALWDNGFAKRLLSGKHNSYANSIFVTASNDVYIAGNDSLNALYWKNEIPVQLPVNDGTYYAQANAIFISGNDVYVAGRQNTNQWEVATYWKNNIINSLDTGITYAQANSIFVKDDNVYVAGYESDHRGYSYAAYWKNDKITKLTSPEFLSNATSIYVNGIDIYVGGYIHDTVGVIASYWKNGNEIDVSIVNPNSYDNLASINSAMVSNNDIYMVGQELINNIFVPRIWKNNIATTLASNTLRFSNAYSIFIKQ